MGAGISGSEGGGTVCVDALRVVVGFVSHLGCVCVSVVRSGAGRARSVLRVCVLVARAGFIAASFLWVGYDSDLGIMSSVLCRRVSAVIWVEVVSEVGVGIGKACRSMTAASCQG